MANLGSNNTPISGESFDLPSGWSFEENVDGEVVITDSGGATIGRRDETNGDWVFDSIVGDTLEATDATVGGSNLSTDYVSAEIAASVAAGNAGIVWVTNLADGETLNVTQAGLVNNDGSAVPSGCDLIIADLTNSVSETTLITGDGTVKDDETGSPLGSYQNSSGGDEQVAVMVDNGNFNSGTGGAQTVVASFIGRVV